MEHFRKHIQLEFTKRTSRNPSYSLRAFAHQLDVHHATLSAIISGKRKITKKSALKLGQSLGMGPKELDSFMAAEKKDPSPVIAYQVLQNEAFARMADWYFDAILELTFVEGFELEAKAIANAIGISSVQAQIALETLESLGLLQRDKKGSYALTTQHSTNILDPDFTSAAQKKYQEAILRKSLEALENIDRTERDHTSTTMAIETRDLPQVKKIIAEFRAKLNAFTQSAGKKPNEVYQLQVSFFPLSRIKDPSRRKP